MCFEKKGIVLDLGAGGTWDDVHVFYPAIMVRDGQVWLYYTGSDGYNYRIGLAVSKDGLTFEKKGIVLDLGADGTWDDVHVFYPAIMVRDRQVWLYYTMYDGSNYRIGLAVSKDGLTFEKKGIVLDLGAGGTWDDVHVSTPAIMVRDGQVWLYYTGSDGYNYRIGLAVSKDGLTFEKKGIVLDLGAGGTWDDRGVYISAVLIRDGQVWLYYSGYDGSNYRIGLAVSKDGLTFEKKGIVLDLGAGGTWDDRWMYISAVLIRDGQVWLYYSGYDGSNYRLGLAVSKTGLGEVGLGALLLSGDGTEEYNIDESVSGDIADNVW